MEAIMNFVGLIDELPRILAALAVSS